MATKTPALSTQLKTAKAEIKALEDKIIKLDKDVKQQSEYKDMYFRQKSELEKKLKLFTVCWMFLTGLFHVKQFQMLRKNGIQLNTT